MKKMSIEVTKVYESTGITLKAHNSIIDLIPVRKFVRRPALMRWVSSELFDAGTGKE